MPYLGLHSKTKQTPSPASKPTPSVDGLTPKPRAAERRRRRSWSPRSSWRCRSRGARSSWHRWKSGPGPQLGAFSVGFRLFGLFVARGNMVQHRVWSHWKEVVLKKYSRWPERTRTRIVLQKSTFFALFSFVFSRCFVREPLVQGVHLETFAASHFGRSGGLAGWWIGHWIGWDWDGLGQICEVLSRLWVSLAGLGWVGFVSWRVWIKQAPICSEDDFLVVKWCDTHFKHGFHFYFYCSHALAANIIQLFRPVRSGIIQWWWWKCSSIFNSLVLWAVLSVFH